MPACYIPNQHPTQLLLFSFPIAAKAKKFITTPRLPLASVHLSFGWIFSLGWVAGASCSTHHPRPRALNACPQYPPIAVTFYGQNFCWSPHPSPGLQCRQHGAIFAALSRRNNFFSPSILLSLFKVLKPKRLIIHVESAFHIVFLQNQVFIFISINIETGMEHIIVYKHKKKTHASLSCIIIYNYYLNIQYKTSKKQKN